MVPRGWSGLWSLFPVVSLDPVDAPSYANVKNGLYLVEDGTYPFYKSDKEDEIREER